MKKPLTVWVNGTLDVLTFAHIQLLKYADSLGDTLICGIDSDARVTQRKGAGRPINNSKVRGEQLDRIKGVALVVEFDTDDELRAWIKELQVDIIVVGEEYRDKEVIGSELVKEVIYFKKIPGYSSTSLIEGNNY